MPDEQPQNPRSAYSIEVLDTRVSALERGVSAILDRLDTSSARTDAAIAAMRDTMAASRVPQWSVLASFFGAAVVIVGALWGTGISPIKQSIESIESTVSTLSRDVRAELSQVQGEVDEIRTGYVTRDAYNDDRTVLREERQTILAGIQKDLDELEGQIDRADELRVPRGEHEERWRSVDLSLANVQRQIDEIVARQGAVYGQRDVILDMQDRIDRMEALLREARE